MGDAQSAQREGTEATAQEHSAEPDAPTPDSAHKLIQFSDINGKSDAAVTEVHDHCPDEVATEAITVKDIVSSVIKTDQEDITNVQITQERRADANEEEPIEIISVDTKQNDLNESFRNFFSNIGLKLTVKRGAADKEDDEGVKEVEQLEIGGETASKTKYEDVEQSTDLNAIQDNDSTTCPTMTDGSPEDLVETAAEIMTETKEITDNIKVQEALEYQDQNRDATLEEFPLNQEGEEIVSPIKKFFTTGIFAGLAKKKKEEEIEDKELNILSKNEAIEEQKEIWEGSSRVAEQEEIECKDVQAEEVPAIEAPEDLKGKFSSTDQNSESEITSSQEKAQSSPFKRLFSGASFKRQSKRLKRRKSSDAKLSDSGECIENTVVASCEKPEEGHVEGSCSPPLPSITEPEEELSAWEAFKKLMTPKKSFKRTSEETQAQVGAGEETKSSEGERISDQSTEEGRKRKDSSHSWEAVLCGSGRRRSRKTSDSEDEQKDGGQVDSQNETGSISSPKQTASPTDSENSTWKSFKRLMTPKRKIKEDEENNDNAQADNGAVQEEALFPIKKLFPGRKNKHDQISSDKGDRETFSMDEDSETPAIIPLSEFDQLPEEETTNTDPKIEEDKLESEQKHVLEIPKTFVQVVQEHQVTPVTALQEDQDELTEFSKYQPLSDIPEEGNVTETLATSLIEEVAKDDTIADDMIEITSEAITAPEPVDITMADETDDIMLSAASHLPESSKTSGNATPVPDECGTNDTDVLLKEVVETILTATKADTVCYEEPVQARVVSSVTHETFGRSAVKELNLMEIHAHSEEVAIETGLQATLLQDTHVEIPSSSISEFKDAMSTEFLSDGSQAEFESAKVDFEQVLIARPVKQESVDDSEYMIESLSEVLESTEMVLQDQNMVQDVLAAENLEMETEANEPVMDKKVEAINKPSEERTEILNVSIPSEPDLPKLHDDSQLELCKEDGAVHRDETVVQSNVQVHPAGKLVEASEERMALQSLGNAAEFNKEAIGGASTKEAMDQLQEETETKEVAEEDFEMVDRQEVLDAQELTQQTQNSLDQQIDIQEEQTCHLSEDDVHTKLSQQNKSGENDPDIPERCISEINEATREEEQPLTDTPPAQEDKILDVNTAQDVAISGVKFATKNLFEETVDDKLEEASLFVDKEIIEPETEGAAEEEAQQGDHIELEPQGLTETATSRIVNNSNELKVQALSETAPDKIGDRNELQQTTEAQEKKSPERSDHEQNVVESSAEERLVVFQHDQVLETNGERTVDTASRAQEIQLDQKNETTEDLEVLPAYMHMHVSSINEDSGVAQVLEDTVSLETSSPILLDTTEEPMHEVHIGQMKVCDERQLEEEIPSAVTELAKVEQAALPEESIATTQQVIPTMSDFILLKTMEDSPNIFTETPTVGVDNAAVQEEPKHEVQPIEVEEVGIQGEKEEEILPPVTSNADVEYAFVAQTSTCSFSDMASRVPEAYFEKTTELNEPTIDTVASGLQHNEPIETTIPLESNVSRVAQEGKTVIIMHVPSVKSEDKHQIQVQVLDVDIQCAERRIDSSLQIVMQEEKEVVYTCHDTIEEVDSVSASDDVPEIASEKDKLIIQEVFQHVKETELKLEEQPESKEPLSEFVDDEINEDQKCIESQTEDAAFETSQGYTVETKDEALTVETKDEALTVETKDEALTVETKDEALTAETKDEALIVETKDKALTEETKDEALTAETKDEALTAETKDEALAAESEDKALTLETKDEALAAETKDEALAAESEDEALTLKTKDEALTAETKDEALSVETKDEALAVETKDEALTSETKDEALTAETKDEALTVATKDEALAAESEDKALTAETKDEALTAETKDEALNVETKDEALAAESEDKALTAETKDEALTAETKDEALNVETKDEALAVDIKDKALSLETKDEALTVQTKDEALTAETKAEALTVETKDEALTEETKDEALTVEIKDEALTVEIKDEALPKMDKEEKEDKKPPEAEKQVASPINKEIALPQNTSIVSSRGNVEAPSSLSLEFKLNIHFGHSQAPITPSPPVTEQSTSGSSPPQPPTVSAVDRSERPKSTEKTEIGVQWVDEKPKQENELEKSEIITAEAAVQATETIEKPMEVLRSVGVQVSKTGEAIEEKVTEMTQNKTILTDVGTQSAELAQQVDENRTEKEAFDNQPKSIDTGIQSFQEEELVNEDRITEQEHSGIMSAGIEQRKKETILEDVVTELVVLRVSGDQIRPGEDEDENQDIWMDAEEDIDGQGEAKIPLCEIEESYESQPDNFQETKSDFEDSFDSIKKTTLMCEGKEEDFTAALEGSQIAAITTMDWD